MREIEYKKPFSGDYVAFHMLEYFGVMRTMLIASARTEDKLHEKISEYQAQQLKEQGQSPEGQIVIFTLVDWSVRQTFIDDKDRERIRNGEIIFAKEKVRGIR